MFISAVYVRFFRSFNYDYLRKTHEAFSPYPWDVLPGDLKYPFVKVDLEKSVTTVVGANESGKSQLLYAIKCALTGNDIRLGDFCRYSQFFAVDDNMSPPDFGLELSGLDAEERVAVSKALKPKSPAVGDRFCLFRFGGRPPVIFIPDQEDWREVEVKSPEALNALLPKSFEIDSNVALPDSVPLHYLAEDKHSFRTAPRRLRRSFIRQVIDNAAEWFGQQPEAPQTRHPAENAFNEANKSSEDHKKQLRLADKLLLEVAGVSRTAFAQLLKAVEDDDDGYANGVVAQINKRLAAKLNLTKWWSQDHHFQLLLTLRDQDLVFTIRDRTGTEYSAGERSMGLRYFLSYFIQYQSHDKPEAGKREILLMDEPDAYLSSAGQQDLLRIFEDFANPEDPQRTPCQVVYVTHSPFLIDKNHGERIRVLEKGEGDEGTRVVRNAVQNHYEPLRSAFGSFVAETTFISNCNLMLEGPADQVLIAGMSARLRRADPDPLTNIDLNTVTLVPAGGAGNVPYLVYLARGRDVEKPAVIVLLDSDKAGDAAVGDLGQGLRGKRLIDKKFILQLGDLQSDEITTGNPEGLAAIEDLIPLGVAVQAVKKYGAAFLTPDKAAELESLTVDDVVYEAQTDTHHALQKAARAKVPGLGLAKVGFARCVLDVVNDGLSVEEARTVDTNFRALFTELGRLQRDAMREFTADKTDTKVKRLKDSFLLDHPDTATKAQVAMLLEEVAASLDNSADADHLRNHMLLIKRNHHLDGKTSDSIPDYSAFKDDLAKLAYALLNDVQLNPAK
ncbi:AAA family ATPase [Umezawaea sp. Da 62-37]|uniref:AAA family ATPase n=1 Tax=Umezawaea sp. Da 62-37 TaxID=3075927 RepID=UPI0028F721A8|nr:AAA family ATPase [Umezawaea sp. Da 62-37]WNV83878.1 AAA family ATPase [Umezawaea sp. Da 62-37]